MIERKLFRLITEFCVLCGNISAYKVIMQNFFCIITLYADFIIRQFFLRLQLKIIEQKVKLLDQVRTVLPYTRTF